MYRKLLVSFLFSLLFISLAAQPKDMEYKVIRSDDIVTISYGTSINKTKSGNHVVWVKAEYHDPDWQRYFSSQIGSKTLVATTLTKAWYDEYYASCMVRRVLLYSKEGKLLFDTGEDSSAGWGYVNASDPVGLVGEYLGK